MFAKEESAKELCAGAGLRLQVFSEYHWQLQGGRVLVNYYPSRGTIYVDGQVHGVRRADIAEAIAAAGGKLPKIGKEARLKSYKGKKRRLFAKSNICYLCTETMTFEEATVDHVIPLSRGGANFLNNLRLAHKSCNNAKGSNLVTPGDQHG